MWICDLHICLKNLVQVASPKGQRLFVPDEVSQIASSAERTTVVWLDDSLDVFGIHSRDFVFIVPADQLVYIEFGMVSTFRGSALNDTLRAYVLEGEAGQRWIDIGNIEPTKPWGSPEKNRLRLRAEFDALAADPLLEARYSGTFKYVHHPEPY